MIVMESKWPIVAEKEDGGHALILELASQDEQTGVNSWEGNGLVVRLNSWREDDQNHPKEVLDLIGKRVRVTIQAI